MLCAEGETARCKLLSVTKSISSLEYTRSCDVRHLGRSPGHCQGVSAPLELRGAAFLWDALPSRGEVWAVPLRAQGLFALPCGRCSLLPLGNGTSRSERKRSVFSPRALYGVRPCSREGSGRRRLRRGAGTSRGTVARPGLRGRGSPSVWGAGSLATLPMACLYQKIGLC